MERWKTSRSSQKGNVYRFLCRGCNEHLGNSYNRAYAEFVQSVAAEVPRRPWSRVSASASFPLRILKTAVQLFVSSLGPDFVAEHPWTRKFLLSREAAEIPRSVRVWAYAMCYEDTGRQSGPVKIADTGRAPESLADLFSGFHDVAEFAFWPLGVVLASDGADSIVSPYGFFPMHSWSQYRFHERVNTMIELPVMPTATPFPLVFSTNEEAERIARGVPPWRQRAW